MNTYLHSNLKYLRSLRGFSTDVVANAIGTKRSTLSAWENQQSEPSCSMLLVLSVYYHMRLDILVGNDLSRVPRSEVEAMQRTMML